ncbi:regulatory protein [Acinetobacter calcoaceticus]|uniref:Regulatory protein RecX n=1 Tax=Acinetobacter calcoaceticus TaxID=471 RepID=A0A4R1XV38_ACICA|nr:regulatory protein [Acinetobacter calcoaceticus]
MSDSKFPKILDYDKLKSVLAQLEQTESASHTANTATDSRAIDPVNDSNQDSFTDQDGDSVDTDDDRADTDAGTVAPIVSGLTGTRLRSYAFAVLTRREYSKSELIDKLMLRAIRREEVEALVDELAASNYQSDDRVAEMTVRSQVRQGKGPYRIKQALKDKKLDESCAQQDLSEIDWHEQAYQMKLKKYGAEVAVEAKIKAKQIRFLQYRGFEMDSIMRAIRRKK